MANLGGQHDKERETHFKTFLHQTGLWAWLWGKFSRLIIDVARLYSL